MSTNQEENNPKSRSSRHYECDMSPLYAVTTFFILCSVIRWGCGASLLEMSFYSISLIILTVLIFKTYDRQIAFLKIRYYSTTRLNILHLQNPNNQNSQMENSTQINNLTLQQREENRLEENTSEIMNTNNARALSDATMANRNEMRLELPLQISDFNNLRSDPPTYNSERNSNCFLFIDHHTESPPAYEETHQTIILVHGKKPLPSYEEAIECRTSNI